MKKTSRLSKLKRQHLRSTRVKPVAKPRNRAVFIEEGHCSCGAAHGNHSYLKKWYEHQS